MTLTVDGSLFCLHVKLNVIADGIDIALVPSTASSALSMITAGNYSWLIFDTEVIWLKLGVVSTFLERGARKEGRPTCTRKPWRLGTIALICRGVSNV